MAGDIPNTYMGFTDTSLRHWEDIQNAHFDSATLVAPVFSAVAFAAIYSAILLAPLFFAFRTVTGLRWSLSKTTRTRRRCETTYNAAQAISACIEVRQASWKNRPRKMIHLAECLKQVEVSVMSLRRTSGYTPQRSHRNHQLKRHAGLVVAALRAAESLIDSDGIAALTRIAYLLTKIGERATEGRIGALLDPEDIDSNLTPARDWESLRLAAAAALVAACGVGVGLLDIPDGASAYVIGGCGVAILVLLYGRRAHQFLDLLNTIRGS
ncbi:hypothetical protein [Streptomyces sp. NPDC001100]